MRSKNYPTEGSARAQRGGIALRNLKGRAYYSKIGRKGGRRNVEKNGVKHMQTIGRAGGRSSQASS